MISDIARPKGWWVPVGAAALALGAAALQPQASADDPEALERYVGHYRLAIQKDTAKQRIEKAIVEGTADMGPLKRAIGRKRLRAKNEVIERIRIALPGDQICITLDEDRYDAPRSGDLVRVRLDDGEVVRVSHVYSKGRITQLFVGDDGRRRDVFVSRPGQSRLDMIVTIFSPKLSKPLSYRLPYRRIGG